MLDKNDHRALGNRLDLYHQQEEAPGMVFWHPRGFRLYRTLEAAVRRQMERDGFAEVRTPQILRKPVFEASGHWQGFCDGMFQLNQDDLPAALKPVSCPGHLEIAKRMSLSYRDLPLSISEFGVVHRDEPSGTLHGLFRLRQFTQDDGHVICEEQQIAEQVRRFCDSLQRFYAAFEFSDLAVNFSTRPDKRVGSDGLWDHAEALLADAAKHAGLECKEQPGGGALYGPKLEFLLNDRLGRRWQCGTIQLDLVMPERFGLAYVDRSGKRVAPALLHRAMLGSLERFIGILLEHYRGMLPAWLAPEQVVILPLAEPYRAYAAELENALAQYAVRATRDERDESLGRRVRDAHERGVPLLCVLGERELARRSVALRNGAVQHELELGQAVEWIERACRPIL